MSLRAFLLLSLFALPVSVAAADVGFPAQSLWLSDTSPSVGEKVRIYSVIYNGTDVPVSGTLTFFVDSKANESRTVFLDAGESTIVSSLWTATEGEHSFSARFAGADIDESEAEVSVSVVAKVDAAPSAAEETIAQAKSVGTQIASTSLPIVSAVAEKVFETTEAVRNAGIKFFEAQQRPPSPATSTPDNQTEGFEAPMDAVPEKAGILSTIVEVTSTGALTILRSLWLFYPLVILFLLLCLRTIYRWATGPRF